MMRFQTGQLDLASLLVGLLVLIPLLGSGSCPIPGIGQ
jgi:hypothetical protein